MQDEQWKPCTGSRNPVPDGTARDIDKPLTGLQILAAYSI